MGLKKRKPTPHLNLSKLVINMTYATLLLFICVSSIFSQSPRELHNQAFLVDAHNDVLLRAMEGEDLSVRTVKGHSDLPRLLEGGVDLQIFAVWVNPYAYLPDRAFQRALDMISKLEELAQGSPQFTLVRTRQDLDRVTDTGILGALIGVEGGHAIENSLEKLRILHDRGMRYLTLTWNNSTDWATSAKDESQMDSLAFRGLTEFGKAVVRTCNEIGVLVDVSHVGEHTFWDVMEITTKPVIASHSCAYALCPHFRNLNDDQLRAIAATGGVVGVNFYAGYLDSTFATREKVVMAKYQPQLDSLAEKYGKESDDYWYGKMALLDTELAAVAPSVDILIDHIDYLVQVMGVDHVGLGSDFDGVDVLPQGIKDCTDLPVITEKLLARGYHQEAIEKILGGNFRRVLETVLQ